MFICFVSSDPTVALCLSSMAVVASPVARARPGGFDNAHSQRVDHRRSADAPRAAATCASPATGSSASERSRRSPSDRIVDAHGLALAPGFIDTHSHHDRGLVGGRGGPRRQRRLEPHRVDPRAGLAMVSQGVTTIVIGQDGGGCGLAALFASIEAQPPAVNIASYVGHGAIRKQSPRRGFQAPRDARRDRADEGARARRHEPPARSVSRRDSSTIRASTRRPTR